MPWVRHAGRLARAVSLTPSIHILSHSHTRPAQVLNGPTADMTYNEVQDRIASWALEVSGLSPAQFTHGWNQGSVDANTRFASKYVAFRSVIGTPTFLLNAVRVLLLCAGQCEHKVAVASINASWGDTCCQFNRCLHSRRSSLHNHVCGVNKHVSNQVPLPELGSGSTVKDFSKYIDPLVSATERA